MISTYPVRTDVITSINNASTTPLGIGGVFTGTADFNDYPDGFVVFKGSHKVELRVQQSIDGVNWNADLVYIVEADTNAQHRFVKGGRYVRVIVTNLSGEAMTSFRLATYYGNFNVLTRPLNTTIYQSDDAQVVRSIDTELQVGAGLFEGFEVVSKFGRNSSIDSGSVPEDIWNGGGLYTGFPTGAPEEIEVFSSDAGDTGVLTFEYLASSTSTAYQTATVTLNGTTPVNTGITAYRVNVVSYDSGNANTFNAGTITVRHRTTTANVFAQVPAGRSQGYVAGYTVPAGHIGIILRTFCSVFNNSVSTSVDGGFYIRELNKGPRIRRPFSAGTAARYEERIYGGLRLEPMTDIIPRILLCTSNNTEVFAGFDILLVKIE